MWSLLNQPEIDDPCASEARRSILAHLGDYAALIVGPLNMRPRAATLRAADDTRVEVRVSTAASHILLVIAPEGDLAAEVYWMRALAAANLPIPRLLAHDLSCGLVPFSYAIESYVSGAPLDWLDDGPRMRVVARQIGRTLRRAHQTPAAGFGRPTTAGRWAARSWGDALRAWVGQLDVWARSEELLGADMAAALRAHTIDHPALACDRPYVLHGAVEPARALVTVGEAAQVEALTRPGDLVGGDPLFDLAHALLPHHPAAFRQGVREGYAAMGALAPAQEARLRRLGVLLQVCGAVRHADAAALAALPEAVAGELRELGGA